MVLGLKLSLGLTPYSYPVAISFEGEGRGLSLDGYDALVGRALNVLTGASRVLAPYVPTPPAVLRVLRKLVSEFNPRVVLDAGCGEGVVAATLSKSGLYTVCIEISRDRLSTAKTSISGKGIGALVDFVEADLTQLGLRRVDLVYTYLLPGSVDVVASMLPKGCILVSLDYECTSCRRLLGALDTGGHVLYVYMV